MRIQSNELKEFHLAALDRHFDALLKAHGFYRFPRSAEAKRSNSESLQVIWLYCRSPQSHSRSYVATVGARLTLYYPAITEILGRLLEGGPFVESKPTGFVDHFDIATLATDFPKLYWEPKDLGELSAAEVDVATNTEKWLLPFADRVSTIRDFLQLYESGDNRISAGLNTFTRIVAMYIYHGNIRTALELARKKSSNYPEWAKTYAPGINAFLSEYSEIFEPQEVPFASGDFMSGPMRTETRKPIGYSLIEEGRPVLRNPTADRIVNEISILRAGGPTFLILERSDGSYVQAAGESGRLTVEYRRSDGNNFEHFVLGRNEEAGSEFVISATCGPIRVYNNEILNTQEASAVFVSFLERGETPKEYAFRDSTSMFQEHI